ncbi:MAG: glycosyltransferase family 2 protein [Myxococcales bacterium]
MSDASSLLVSYVIPCYRSEPTIHLCLEAIVGQEGGFAREIILVDSSPTDALGQQLGRYESRERTTIAYVHTREQKNPGEARNLGLERVKGDFIACLDSDVVANPRWTLQMLERHRALGSPQDLLLLGGSMVNSDRTDHYLANALVLIEFYTSLPAPGCERRSKLPSLNLFFSKATLPAIRFPSARMCEDMMLCRDFEQRGGRIFFVGDNPVEHVTRHRFLKSTYQQGMGSANYRLSSAARRDQALYAALLPFGAAYKLLGIARGLARFNRSRLPSLLYYAPALAVGLCAYNVGMARGLVNHVAGIGDPRDRAR